MAWGNGKMDKFDQLHSNGTNSRFSHGNAAWRVVTFMGLAAIRGS
jgi:hypothetical protein